MSSTFKNTLSGNQYFMSLPHFVQESIKQSSVEINSEEDLKNVAEKIMSK